MTVLLPVSIAMERMIVIGFPYRHRSIMTTKTVVSVLAAMWGLSTILTAMIIIIVPVDIVWSLAVLHFHILISAFFGVVRLTSGIFIVVVNVFLLHKVTVSNRKAKENERLGNEEEAKRFEKLVQLLRGQAKATVTLLLVGGIDVIGNMLLPFMYGTIRTLQDTNNKIYLEQFLMYPLRSLLLLSHPLVYGLYMKKIRRRLPNCTACPGQWNTHRSRVITLHQQP